MECGCIFVAKLKFLEVVHHSVYNGFNRDPHGVELHSVMPLCCSNSHHFCCVTLFIVFLAGACMAPNYTQKCLYVAVASFLYKTPCILFCV